MRKAFVFDWDDTLATTSARIRLVQQGSCPENDEIVGYIKPKDFSGYELDLGEYFDFTEFRNNEFIRNGDATWLMNLASEVHDEGHDVYILTAREDNSSDAIEEFLLQYGIKAKAIHCVGALAGKTEDNKRKVLMMLIKEYDRIYFYDDCSKNIDKAPDKQSYPNFRKYKVEL